MEMLICLSPDDKMNAKIYTGSSAIESALGEEVHCTSIIEHDLPLIPGMSGSPTMSMVVDDEFLYNAEPTVNAYATLLTFDNEGYHHAVYGNAVLLMNKPDGSLRGFDSETEMDLAMQMLRGYFNTPDVKHAAALLHEEYDNNMPEPRFEIIEFNDPDR